MRLFRYIPFTLSAIIGSIVVDLIVVQLLGMPERLPLLLVIDLAAVVLGLVLDAARLRQRPFEFRAFAPFPPDEILDRADTWFEHAGWVVREGPDECVVAERQPALNTATLLVLLVAGVVPGIVYLLVARRAKVVTMTVLAVEAQGGGTVELKGTGLSSEALAFFRGLHAESRRRPDEPDGQHGSGPNRRTGPQGTS